MKKYFIIISLFICFNLNAAEIEIISDKPGEGKKIIIIRGFKLSIQAHLRMEKFLILMLVKIDR